MHYSPSGRAPFSRPAPTSQRQALGESASVAKLDWKSASDQTMINSNGLRKAELIDAPKIARVHVASWLETYKGILPDEMLAALSVERRTHAWELMLSD